MIRNLVLAAVLLAISLPVAGLTALASTDTLTAPTPVIADEVPLSNHDLGVLLSIRKAQEYRRTPRPWSAKAHLA